MLTLEEKWVDIIDYTKYYQISNLGRIRSKQRVVSFVTSRNNKKFNKVLIRKSRFLKTRLNTTGYPHVILKVNNAFKTFLVHRLVASHFIPNPNLKPDVHHIDNDKTNYKINNLQWVTEKENLEYAKKDGMICKGERKPNSKLNQTQVLFIRQNYPKKSQKYLAQVFGINQGLVSRIVNNLTWQ